MLCLAIDQHSKQLTVNLRYETGEVLLRRQVSARGDAPRQHTLTRSRCRRCPVQPATRHLAWRRESAPSNGSRGRGAWPTTGD